MRMLPSSSHLPPRQKRGPQRGRLARCALVATALFVAQILSLDKANSDTNYKPMHYRQYILIELNNFTEAYCLIELYTAESRLNPNARNGSHYGIPQGRSKYLATVGGTKQIDWGIKYNLNRYGSMCNALDHYKRKGWH
jgi:hypothetical protein